MRRLSNGLRVLAVMALLVIAGTMLGNAQQKASVPRPQDKMAMGEDSIKQLLTLMVIDKNGGVTKQEFLKFMAAEFDRLDKNRAGELNVKELTRSNLSASGYVGK
jgi:hypothetical protein